MKKGRESNPAGHRPPPRASRGSAADVSLAYCEYLKRESQPFLLERGVTVADDLSESQRKGVFLPHVDAGAQGP